MNTAMQELTNGVVGMLGQTVFPAIAKGLKDNKGVDVTLEELAKWCNLPMNRSLQPAMPFGGAVPAPVTTATTSTAGAKKKPGTKVEVKPLLNPDGSFQTSTGKPFIEGKSCKHFYEKGLVNAGKFCGRDVVKGTDYCSTKSHKDKENKQKVQPGVAPKIEVAQPEPEDNGGLQVKWYDEERELYEEITNNFILKAEGSEENPIYLVFGKLHPDNNIKPLTENEKVIAKALGLTVPDVEEPKAPVVQMPVQMPMQMPMQVPQQVQIPQAVQQVAPQIPMPIPIPQMPRAVPQFPK